MISVQCGLRNEPGCQYLECEFPCEKWSHLLPALDQVYVKQQLVLSTTEQMITVANKWPQIKLVITKTCI